MNLLTGDKEINEINNKKIKGVTKMPGKCIGGGSKKMIDLYRRHFIFPLMRATANTALTLP